MFELKKIISSIITIPGIFILLLLMLAFSRRKIIRIYCILFCIFIYLISVSPVANFFIGLVEINSIYRGTPSADVIILLGGGVIDGANDISGKSIPHPDMVVRLTDAVRLYRKYHLPIIISGGSVSGVKEAPVVKRFLVDLGVKEKDIFMESRSLDTVDNAVYVKAILKEKGFKNGVLVTSAYHMKRAEFIFKKTGIKVTPHSAGSLFGEKKTTTMYDFLPGIHSLKKSALSLRESIGYLFYLIKYSGGED